jgi:hypothetical protein
MIIRWIYIYIYIEKKGKTKFPISHQPQPHHHASHYHDSQIYPSTPIANMDPQKETTLHNIDP